jgi:hypothetical protein
MGVPRIGLPSRAAALAAIVAAAWLVAPGADAVEAQATQQVRVRVVTGLGWDGTRVIAPGPYLQARLRDVDYLTAPATSPRT